jgi:hypothetical protein
VNNTRDVCNKIIAGKEKEEKEKSEDERKKQ